MISIFISLSELNVFMVNIVIDFRADILVLTNVPLQRPKIQIFMSNIDDI